MNTLSGETTVKIDFPPLLKVSTLNGKNFIPLEGTFYAGNQTGRHKSLLSNMAHILPAIPKKGKRKVQEVLQSQTAALPRHQEEEKTDKTKQAQIEQTYEKH